MDDAGKAIPKVTARRSLPGGTIHQRFAACGHVFYGKVLRPPSFVRRSLPAMTVLTKAMTGVFVVRDGDFVGVAARAPRGSEGS